MLKKFFQTDALIRHPNRLSKLKKPMALGLSIGGVALLLCGPGAMAAKTTVQLPESWLTGDNSGAGLPCSATVFVRPSNGEEKGYTVSTSNLEGTSFVGEPIAFGDISAETTWNQFVDETAGRYKGLFAAAIKCGGVSHDGTAWIHISQVPASLRTLSVKSVLENSTVNVAERQPLWTIVDILWPPGV